MITDQRVIFETTDISKEVNDYRSGSVLFEPVVGEYLYIGSILPFNNLWLESATPNTNPANVNVQIWYNGAWTNAVDIVDETSGLTKSGRIQWNTDIDKSWQIEQKSETITELSTFKIYNMYWARLTWDANLVVGTTLEYVGQKFSDDSVFFSFYPDLSQTNLLVSYETGKTDWDEQHFMAAEQIVRDLKKKNIIKSRSQLLDHSLFTDASCHKAAEIIYTAFGIPYVDMRTAAAERYQEAINLKNFNVDLDQDGRLDPVERVISTRFMSR